MNSQQVWNIIAFAIIALIVLACLLVLNDQGVFD
jgi:hypothetical protein